MALIARASSEMHFALFISVRVKPVLSLDIILGELSLFSALDLFYFMMPAMISKAAAHTRFVMMCHSIGDCHKVQ